MKKLLYSLIVLSFIATSCDEFVEPDPKDRITPEVALGDLDGTEAFLFSAYNRMHAFNYYGQNLNLTGEALADNIIIGNNTGRYAGAVVNAVGSHFGIWGLYGAINDANIVIENAEINRDENSARADIMIAEARFLRALIYHDLSRIYSYEPGQEVGGFNQGVILRTTAVDAASEADFRPRSTNTEVYAQIEADLLAAIADLPAEGDQADFPDRASVPAARALLARVYLYAGRYAEAATQADAALAATSADVVAAADYIDSFAETNHPEAIFQINIQAVDWSTVDGVNNSMTTVTKTTAGGAPGSSQGAVRASDELLAAFETGDIRRDLFRNPESPDFWEPDKWPGELGDFREHIPIIRVSEVVLIAAEAKARSGNDAGALTDLNTIRTNRGLAASTATGSDLIDAILQERRVELCYEGSHRYFDLKRLGLTIPKPARSGVDPLSANDFRRLSRIPPSEIEQHADAGVELVQNPGY